MADLKKLAEELVNLTVKDVKELADILKEEYGIEPAAAAVAVAACFALTNYGGKLSALPSVPFTFDNREHYWKFAESEMGQKILDEPSGLSVSLQ